ncbi:sporulation membrane protein YtaF [Paenibacillus sp. N3/727]|uniref:sporulation membrane protein YtaF n=1 Tax=Paenibacillus sp. N3/727 TaxID=2925845 RepID=UPI001F53059B|nr:sporulation membrane protein YtaF [Paenibacillus sp. N3/727]UNK16103.1 sporulation membrane protein YtaF [Paenibacillus sp. N3/727]
MNWLLILGFTISSSLDNLGVGISYGIRNIRIGIISNLLIAAVCFMFSYSGIWFGKWISAVLPGVLPVLLGTFILLVIGLRIILLAVPRGQKETAEPDPKAKGITAILRNPERVDLDKSNDIGIFESLILGVALSANALTNGLSAGLLGLSPLIISLTAAIGSFLTVWLGVWLGNKVAGVRIGPFTLGQFGTFASGIILLLIAANNLF